MESGDCHISQYARNSESRPRLLMPPFEHSLQISMAPGALHGALPGTACRVRSRDSWPRGGDGSTPGWLCARTSQQLREGGPGREAARRAIAESGFPPSIRLPIEPCRCARDRAFSEIVQQAVEALELSIGPLVFTVYKRFSHLPQLSICAKRTREDERKKTLRIALNEITYGSWRRARPHGGRC